MPSKAKTKKAVKPNSTFAQRKAAAIALAKRAAAARPQSAKSNDEKSLEQIWKTYEKTHDENLRNILLEKYLPMVRYISERLLQTLPKSIELDDLCSAGLFGLMDAIEGFDLSRGIKFKTYCTTRIRGSILDELRSQDWVPRLVRVKAHKLDRAYQEIEGKYGRQPTTFEIAKKLGLGLQKVGSEINEASPKTIFSLSEKWDEGDDEGAMEKVEVLEDKKGQDPMALFHHKDVLDLLTRVLTKKERLIVMMYYQEGLTMREIGEILHLTESRVCQIHSNVMARLKQHFEKMRQALMS